jgi:phenylalanine-4-hydroxylase
MATDPKDNYITSVVFSIHDEVGALQQVLAVIKKHDLNMSRIESRPSTTREFDYDFFVDFSGADMARVMDFTDELRKNHRGEVISVKTTNLEATTSKSYSNIVPWFPRKLNDLDTFADKVFTYGSELDADHPGFKDEEYRRRRQEIAAIARQYRTGSQIPRIEYNDAEKATWRTVFRKLKELFPTHACKQHTYVFPLLEQNCGYTENNIPQLQDVSDFLQDCTGWTLRPVMGLLTPRDFLNAFAFRIFHSTQYIRHHSQPLYTPEPDVCHELLGHVPLFADPDFADFSHEIGLASLGASEDEIERLSTLYWFTAEFGLCKEGDGVKAYGAGLLSSFGELEYCLTDKPLKKSFDPFLASTTKYPITEYQPLYFVTESFEDAKKKVREFAESLSRPFTVRYNPYTKTVEVVDTKPKLLYLANNLKSELNTLTAAINKLNITSMFSV